MARLPTEGADSIPSGWFANRSTSSFENPAGPPDQFSSLNFDLTIQDDAAYSEADASIQAFKFKLLVRANQQT